MSCYNIGPQRILHTPGGGGGYCPIWAIQVCAAVKGMVFKQFILDKVYKSERLGLEYAIIFHETDQLVEDFI